MDGLELVPVWIANERGVVGSAVVRAGAGLSLAGAARLEGRCVEGVYRPAIRGAECQVEPTACSQWIVVASEQRQAVVAAGLAVANGIVGGPHTGVAQGAKHRVVEGRCATEIPHSQREVTDHCDLHMGSILHWRRGVELGRSMRAL